MTNTTGLITVTKEESIMLIQENFRGFDEFISSAITMVASVSDFKGIESIKVLLNEFDWEVFLSIEIEFGETGYKRLTYREGNAKHDTLSQVHDYSIQSNGGKEVSWDA